MVSGLHKLYTLFFFYTLEANALKLSQILKSLNLSVSHCFSSIRIIHHNQEWSQVVSTLKIMSSFKEVCHSPLPLKIKGQQKKLTFFTNLFRKIYSVNNDLMTFIIHDTRKILNSIHKYEEESKKENKYKYRNKMDKYISYMRNNILLF